MRRFALSVTASLVPAGAPEAWAFDKVVTFGDSTVDSGWYRNLEPPDPGAGNPLFNSAPAWRQPSPSSVAPAAGTRRGP